MQQFLNLDRDLNYIPYRYRNRSNPHPKKIQSQIYSHSQRKKPRFNPELHINISKNTKNSLKETFGSGDKQEQQQEIFPHRKNGFKMNQFEHFDSVISSLFSPSSSAFNSQEKADNKKQLTQYKYKKDLSFDGNEESEEQQHQQSIEKQDEQDEQEQKVVNLKKNSIFNQSQVEQMKQQIIQNIEQVNKEERQDQQTNYLSRQQQIKPFSRFEKRYQRLKGLNRQQEQRNKYHRNIKYKQMAQLSKKNDHKYPQRVKQLPHQSLYPKQPKQTPIVPQLQKDALSVNTNNNIAKVNQEHQLGQTKDTNRIQLVNKLKLTQGTVKMNHFQNNASLNNQINLFDQKYKNNSHTKPILKIPLPPSQIQEKLQQTPKPQTFEMLSYFTKQASNKVIKSLKQSKSKQKMAANSLQPSYSSSYSQVKNNPIKYNNSKGANNQQSYTVNMKKKKQKVSIIQINKAKQKSANLKQIKQQRQISKFPIEQKYEQQVSINLNQQKKPEFQGQNSQAYSQNNQGQILSHPTSRIQQKSSNRGQSSSIFKSQDQDQILKMIDSVQVLKMMTENSCSKESSLFVEQQFPSQHNNILIQHNQKELINSNQQQHSQVPSAQNFSISSSSLYISNHFEEPVSFNLKQQLEKQQTNNLFQIQVQEKAQSLIQINQDSTVFQGQQINRYQSQNLMKINLDSLHRKQELLDSFNPNSRRTNQAQIDQNSIRQYRNHFHPKNEAIRKFKHAKHSSSADVHEKVLKSSRINHSVSTLKRNLFNLQLVQRRKTRKQKNASRFKTRMTPT